MAETSIAKRERQDYVQQVSSRIQALIRDGDLHLPPNYSATNALKAAWLLLQSTEDKDKRPVLEVCTRESIANALLDMVVQGLNPVKRQCYFIAYGNQLVCQRSYFGDMALVQRVLPGAQIYFGVVYEGDEFAYEIERGKKRITKHVQRLENVDPAKIRAAYCVIEDKDGRLVHTEVMTIEQIKQSWKQSRQYNPNGGSTPHHTFPDQMCIRTVVRRACKTVVNESSDDYLLLHYMNRSDDLAAEAEMEAEVAARANGRVIDVEVVAPEPSEPAAGVQSAQGAATGPNDGGATAHGTPSEASAPSAAERAAGRPGREAHQMGLDPGF